MKITQNLTLSVASLLIASGAGGETVAPAATQSKTLAGTITYRERMLLPPDATVTVRLEDVTLMDVPAKLMAETSFPAVGAPPYHFRLSYPAAEILPRRSYGLRVRIEHDGKLLFINDARIDPFTEVAGDALDIVLAKVSGRASPVRPPASMPDASLTGTYWKAILIDEEATYVTVGQPEIHLVLQPDGLARGHSGCNRFSGPFTNEKNTIEFGGLASTRRACLKGMEQEQRFLKALSAASGFRIQGDTLTLTDAEGTERLYFEAVYLR